MVDTSVLHEMEIVGYLHTNFHKIIDEAVLKQIVDANGTKCGKHSALTYDAYIYYKDGKYCAEVWSWGKHHHTMTCEIYLEALIHEIQENFGWK